MNIWLYILAAGAGFLAAFIFIACDVQGTQGACRAANPGHECHLGWVAAEAFK